MNPLYQKAKDVILIRRTSDNKEFEEYPLTLQPQSALVTDPTNDIVCFSLCNLPYASTSSLALMAISASWANSSSYSLTSSFAFVSLYASASLEASAAFFATTASYAETASVAWSASYISCSSAAFVQKGIIILGNSGSLFGVSILENPLGTGTLQIIKM